MPGEADRLKKENESLLRESAWLRDQLRGSMGDVRVFREEARKLSADNASLEGSLELANEAVDELRASLELQRQVSRDRDPELEAMRDLRDKAVRQAMEVREEMKELRKESARLIQEQMGVLVPRTEKPGHWDPEGDLWPTEDKEPVWAPAVRIYKEALAEEMEAKRLRNEAAPWGAFKYVDPDRQAWDKLEGRVKELAGLVNRLEGDLQDLASREDQRAEALRVQMLGLIGRLNELEMRMDKVAAAYDAWGLMRDNQNSLINALNNQVRLLEHEVKKNRRRWKR